MKRKQKFKPAQQSLYRSFIWAVPFAVVGVMMLILTRAATLPMNIEVEQGVVSGTGIVGIRTDDPSASDGKYMIFGARPVAGPGCGLPGEVFCENFESGPVAVANRLRSGDFDSNKISASRLGGTQYESQEGDQGSRVNWVDRAQIPAGCRSGSVTDPLPAEDTLICEPNSSIGTRHGLTATAVQNYGDNYYRINQPFDIANRTGTVTIDASLHLYNALTGYTTIAFSNEPIASPSIRAENGNGISMKEGFFLSFFCDGGGVVLRKYTNYIESDVPNELGFCNDPGITTRVGNLNRVQLKLSRNNLEVYATDYSTNGTAFGTPKLIYRGNPGLTFDRGFLGFGGHNHATEKYCPDRGCAISASQNIVWDNIAFDGPAITPAKNYQIADNRTPVASGISLGYNLPLLSDPVMSPFTFKSVQTAGMTKATLSTNMFIVPWANPTNYKLHYRLNGGAWHEFPIADGIRSLVIANGSNRFNLVATVATNELINGDNTIQFAFENVNNSAYPPFIANIDLLVQ